MGHFFCRTDQKSISLALIVAIAWPVLGVLRMASQYKYSSFLDTQNSSHLTNQPHSIQYALLHT
jgi:hypothetical protein